MSFDPDDLPIGIASNWDSVAAQLRTFWVTGGHGEIFRADSREEDGDVPLALARVFGVARKAPDADERIKARYKTEAWKAQHRIHARESARRMRAAKKAAR